MDIHDTQTDLAETLRRAALAKGRAAQAYWSAYDEHGENHREQKEPGCDYCTEED